jgi:hypothetical protein
MIIINKYYRGREIAYGFGGPSEKKCQSSLQPAWITPNPHGFANNRGVEID